MRNPELGPAPIDGKKPRRGCLGCLTRMLGTLLVLGLGAAVAFVALNFIFYPWGFYFGGHSHLLPLWQGIGRMHRADGDYVLYFWIEPTNSGSHMYNFPTVKGMGYLCTPRGERFVLQVRGGMPEKTGRDTNGKEMTINLYHRPWYYRFVRYDSRPRLQFRGKWEDPELVMDDGGTLNAAFLPGGTLAPRSYTYYHKDAADKLPIVFHETAKWLAYRNDCRASGPVK